jgi:hypothetical protein
MEVKVEKAEIKVDGGTIIAIILGLVGVYLGLKSLGIV